jgi:hypothetical protein
VVNRRLAIAIAVAGSSLGACSLVTSLDGLSSGAADSDATTPEAGDGSSVDTRGPDGAPVDAPGVDGGARDGAPDAAPPANLAPNPGFETGKPSCAPWAGYENTLVSVSPGRSSATACLVCSKPGAPFFTIDGDVVDAPPIGARYRAEAWVRAPADGPRPEAVGAHLRTYNLNGGFQDVEQGVGRETAVTSSWVLITTTLTVTKPAPHLDFYIAGSPGGESRCFVVDDFVVVREN